MDAPELSAFVADDRARLIAAAKKIGKAEQGTSHLVVRERPSHAALIVHHRGFRCGTSNKNLGRICSCGQS
jgi:hypothetical protein